MIVDVLAGSEVSYLPHPAGPDRMNPAMPGSQYFWQRGGRGISRAIRTVKDVSLKEKEKYVMSLLSDGVRLTQDEKSRMPYASIIAGTAKLPSKYRAMIDQAKRLIDPCAKVSIYSELQKMAMKDPDYIWLAEKLTCVSQMLCPEIYRVNGSPPSQDREQDEASIDHIYSRRKG